MTNAFNDRLMLSPRETTISQAPPPGPAAPATPPAAPWYNKFGARFKEILDEPRNAWIGMNPLGRAASAGLGMMGVGQVAYHGSPHIFSKFLKAKIGTGEGHQVYGHGLYFAENPAVAKGYANEVKNMPEIDRINTELDRLNKIMQADSTGQYRKFKSPAGEAAAKEYDRMLDLRDTVRTTPGSA